MKCLGRIKLSMVVDNLLNITIYVAFSISWVQYKVSCFYYDMKLAIRSLAESSERKGFWINVAGNRKLNASKLPSFDSHCWLVEVPEDDEFSYSFLTMAVYKLLHLFLYNNVEVGFREKLHFVFFFTLSLLRIKREVYYL